MPSQPPGKYGGNSAGQGVGVFKKNLDEISTELMGHLSALAQQEQVGHPLLFGHVEKITVFKRFLGSKEAPPQALAVLGYSETALENLNQGDVNLLNFFTHLAVKLNTRFTNPTTPMSRNRKWRFEVIDPDDDNGSENSGSNDISEYRPEFQDPGDCLILMCSSITPSSSHSSPKTSTRLKRPPIVFRLIPFVQKFLDYYLLGHTLYPLPKSNVLVKCSLTRHDISEQLLKSLNQTFQAIYDCSINDLRPNQTLSPFQPKLEILPLSVDTCQDVFASFVIFVGLTASALRNFIAFDNTLRTFEAGELHHLVQTRLISYNSSRFSIVYRSTLLGADIEFTFGDCITSGRNPVADHEDILIHCRARFMAERSDDDITYWNPRVQIMVKIPGEPHVPGGYCRDDQPSRSSGFGNITHVY